MDRLVGPLPDAEAERTERAAARGGSARPFEGVRIVDFTHEWAGPIGMKVPSPRPLRNWLTPPAIRPVSAWGLKKFCTT